MGRSHEYIYGTSAREIRRLSLQHRLWADHCTAHWLRAGFQEGHALLDLGAGPGFATFDLAELVGPEGSICAVEPEEEYAEVIRAELERGAVLPRAPVRVVVEPGERAELPKAAFDGVYARWMFTFVPDLSPLLERLHGTLRPGGALAIFDYLDWPGMCWGPSQVTLESVRAAVLSMFEGFGTDGRVGQRLPGALHEAGFDVVELRPVARVARPNQALWRWPELWMHDFLPETVQAGYMSEAEFEAWRKEWASNAAHAAGFFSTPTQIEIIARRR